MSLDASQTSRRTVLGWLALHARAVASPASHQPPSAGKAVRPSTSELSRDQAQWLDYAYDKLNTSGALTASNVFHSSHCSGALDVHNSVRFLYWHRAYLMKHQQALWDAVPADKREFVNLPYWPFHSSRSLSFPSAYNDNRRYPHLYRSRDTTAPSERDNNFQNSKLALRGVWPLTDFWVPNPKLPADGSARFFGKKLKPVHDTLHNAVGGEFRSLQTAALDPLFYCFHAEIDRIWHSWSKLTGKYLGLEPQQVKELTADFEAGGKPLLSYANLDDKNYDYSHLFSPDPPREQLTPVEGVISDRQHLSVKTRHRPFFLRADRHFVTVSLRKTTLPVGQYVVVLRKENLEEIQAGCIGVLSEAQRGDEHLVSFRPTFRETNAAPFKIVLKPSGSSTEIVLDPDEVTINRISRRR